MNKQYISTADKEFLILCSVRYALTRRSYAVAWVAGIVEENLSTLSRTCLDNIQEDIDDFIDSIDDAYIQSVWDQLDRAIDLRNEGRK